MSHSKHLVAITACPSGVAHTYLAAESLEQAAAAMGYTIDVETHGSIGVENKLADEAIERAEAVIIAADKAVDLDRFGGKRMSISRAADGIHKPQQLIEQALASNPTKKAAPGTEAGAPRQKSGAYGMLMNGVSHMIPFVVVGGLFLAVAFGIGGVPGPAGMEIPEGTIFATLMQVGALGMGMMVPILSGYIAYAIADRPGLAPGVITGLLAITPAIYGSEAGTGFLGGIVTGFLSGYIALAIKRIPVHKYVAPIWPIIVIPVLTTLVVSGAFIYVLGRPIASLFGVLTTWLTGMEGASALLLGAILGAMIGFDMGGPVNKVAFLFASGLITSGSYAPAGMVGVAIAVPPMGLALASFLSRKHFTAAERQNGVAALFMGFFGITEGAVPFAAARPLQVIPANVLGAAAGGAVAGVLGVQSHVPWGGLITVLVGAVAQPFAFVIALAVGCAVTALVAIGLISITSGRGKKAAVPAAPEVPAAATPAPAPAAKAPAAVAGATSINDYASAEAIDLALTASDRDTAIRTLVELAARTGRIHDVEDVVDAALRREAQFSTAVGNGIAIPHAKTDGVTAPVVAFARSTESLDWNSPSGDRAQLLFLIAVPASAAGNEHLKILARLSRALAKAPFREALTAAATPQDVMELLQEHVQDRRPQAASA